MTILDVIAEGDLDLRQMAAAEVLMNRTVAEHEASHVAAALLLGLDVDRADRHWTTVSDWKTTRGTVVFGSARIRWPEERDDDARRKMATVLLAGDLGQPSWPPPWPLSAAPLTPDEKQVGALVEEMGYGQAEYEQLTADAWALSVQPAFERIQAIVAAVLDERGQLGGEVIDYIKSQIVEKNMTVIDADLAVKRTATPVTDAVTDDVGDFVALAAAWTVDRQNERIRRGAFTKTLAKWQASGKRIPLLWHHRAQDPASHVGSVDPAQCRETAQGLEVAGTLDIADSTQAREAWRAMKNGSMSLSFGYHVIRSVKADHGIRDLVELDLVEVSLTPTPANADTRIVAMKAMDDGAPSLDALAARAAALGLPTSSSRPDEKSIYPSPLDAEKLKREMYDAMTLAMSTKTGDEHRITATGDALRAKADAIADEFKPPQPIEIRVFEA